ncbi:hypothetical protein GQ43DRAFT_444129, partial [Delitschia confertaspora ATCC 74209]
MRQLFVLQGNGREVETESSKQRGREQTAREQTAREQTAREQIAREQTARETDSSRQRGREQRGREQTARDREVENRQLETESSRQGQSTGAWASVLETDDGNHGPRPWKRSLISPRTAPGAAPGPVYAIRG